jgi:hypothetical protein
MNADTKARRFAERATALYEERVLGRRVVTLAEGLEALVYMMNTEPGRALMREAWPVTQEEDDAG